MEKDKKPADTPQPHPPTDHNPYPYPIQKSNRKGWIRALWALIIVAVVVTLFCLVVGIYEHHQQTNEEVVPADTTSLTVDY